MKRKDYWTQRTSTKTRQEGTQKSTLINEECMINYEVCSTEWSKWSYFILGLIQQRTNNKDRLIKIVIIIEKNEESKIGISKRSIQKISSYKEILASKGI